MNIDAVRLRQLLPALLSGSSLDCIRGIDVNGDRAMLVERLTQSLPPADDLRFLHTSGGGREIAVLAERLPWDSDFFGYDIARLDAVIPLQPDGAPPHEYRAAVDALVHQAAARGITYLFASIEARDISTRRALGEAGFSMIETRLTYHRDLHNYLHDRRYPVRIATADDVELLAQVAREAVNPYDRFHADPFISRSDADRLMTRWVEASVLDGFADVTFVPDVPRPKAFCTVKYHRDKWAQWGLRLTQPVFSAVAPEFKGWYMKLISEISYHLKDLGAEHAYLTTQATNSVVLRIWESLGYRYGKAEHILRKVITSGSG